MATQPIGTLYLLPAPLGDAALDSLPAQAIALMHRLDHFICERGKTTRHLLKATGIERPLQNLHFYELHKRVQQGELTQFIAPLLAGEDMGLLSEAGLPGIADPGARIVRLAHERGIPVRPISGPSSMLLALISSGLSGQSFCFHGYLSAKRDQLARDLQRLEQQAIRHGQTQLFMEAPYRNTQVLETALKTLKPDTCFCVAAMLTTPLEYIRSCTIKEWRMQALPDLHKQPAVFVLGVRQFK